MSAGRSRSRDTSEAIEVVTGAAYPYDDTVTVTLVHAARPLW
jgi:hypothetical protein